MHAYDFEGKVQLRLAYLRHHAIPHVYAATPNLITNGHVSTKGGDRNIKRNTENLICFFCLPCKAILPSHQLIVWLKGNSRQGV